MNVLWNEGYSPAQASRGSWVVLNPTDLTTLGYPATGGQGKYAELVYIAGSSAAGASATNPTYASILKPNTTHKYSQTMAANSSAVVNFSPVIENLEIYNNSINDVYLSFIPSDTYVDVATGGLMIQAGSFYSIERTISTLTLANSSSTTSNLRIIGHYLV